MSNQAYPQVATSLLTLGELPLGQQALVTRLLAGGPTRRRLLDLGMVPGTPVTALRRSPSGDPTAFRVRGSVLALRRADASLILVRPTRG